MERLSAVVLLLFFVFAKPVHHVILFFLSARFSLPVALPQKEHRNHLFKKSVFWKSLYSLILIVPASLLLSWGRCLLLRHDLRPSLLSINFLDFLIVHPGSHCERLTTHKTNPNPTITICSLPRKEKEANRLFLDGDL